MANVRITAEHWQFLAALATYGSIRAVAQKLYSSETKVRRHLRELSEACAVPVVETVDRMARVTQEGQRLLERLDPILNDQASVAGRLERLLELQSKDLLSAEICPETLGPTEIEPSGQVLTMRG